MEVDVFHNRRMTSPRQFNGEKLTEEEIKAILEAARWAPTHKMTEPWRYVVLRDQAIDRLARFVEKAYKEMESPPSESKIRRKVDKIRKADTILLILLHRDEKKRIPEWEEIAALACSVENMWLYACNSGLAGYWSTPFFKDLIGDFVDLEENERCLGLFYLGKTDIEIPDNRERKSIKEISRWIIE